MRSEIVLPPAAKVTFISGSTNADALIAMATRVYTHKISPCITLGEVELYNREIKKTKLQTPLEMVTFAFLIEDVTRAFTHQIVRYRVGTAFSQESLRFSVHDKMRVLATDTMIEGREVLPLYAEAVEELADKYYYLLEHGAAPQDARGLLPTNILTSIFVSASLRTWANMYTQRMCCMAQPGEWQDVLSKVKKGIANFNPTCAEYLVAPGQRPEGCGFNASFDKPCKFRTPTKPD